VLGGQQEGARPARPPRRPSAVARAILLVICSGPLRDRRCNTMAPPDDLSPEMPRFPLDDATADRLLSGRVHPDDAPPGYARLAATVRDAKAPATAVGLAGRDEMVARVSAAIREHGGIDSPSGARNRRKSMIGKLLTLKAAGIAIPALALTAGAAAAATGSLPNPAQSTVSTAHSRTGITAPHPSQASGSGGGAVADGVSSGSTNGSGSSGTRTHPAQSTPVGPDATGPAMFGLCTAYKAQHAGASTTTAASGTVSSRAGSSVAFANLAAAAKAKDQTIAVYCGAMAATGGGAPSASSASGTGASASGTGSSSVGRPAAPTSVGAAASGNSHVPTNPGPPASTPASSNANPTARGVGGATASSPSPGATTTSGSTTTHGGSGTNAGASSGASARGSAG